MKLYYAICLYYVKSYFAELYYLVVLYILYGVLLYLGCNVLRFVLFGSGCGVLGKHHCIVIYYCFFCLGMGGEEQHKANHSSSQISCEIKKLSRNSQNTFHYQELASSKCGNQGRLLNS